MTDDDEKRGDWHHDWKAYTPNRRDDPIRKGSNRKSTKRKQDIGVRPHKPEPPRLSQDTDAGQTRVRIKDRLKEMTIERLTVDEMFRVLEKEGTPVNKVTISNLRSSFRDAMKYLDRRGNLRGIEL